MLGNLLPWQLEGAVWYAGRVRCKRGRSRARVSQVQAWEGEGRGKHQRGTMQVQVGTRRASNPVAFLAIAFPCPF